MALHGRIATDPTWQLFPRPGRSQANQPQLKVGSFNRSFCGTGSTGCPAFRHAANPPVITNARNPCLLSSSATRALVASRAQVQYR